MTKLPDRLKLIAENINQGETMADIGTDHGFLPFYLWKNGICPKIIITDISEASLEKAKGIFREYPENAGVDFREGDGLGVLLDGEVDTVIIAGMGGVLITRILGGDILKTLSFKRYILQPRNGSGKLRYWLEKAGFSILSENLAAEGKFICEIITAKPPARTKEAPSLKEYRDEIEYEMPRKLPDSDKELFARFINKKLAEENNIFKSMVSGKTAAYTKIERSKIRIKFLEGLLKEDTENDVF